MKRLLPFVAAVCLLNPAYGQLPQIRVTGIFPAGAQAGTSVDITVTAGTDLDEASELVLTHPGLTAEPKKDGNGQPIANQFTVSVAGDVRPGLYDVRLKGLFGVSNPRVFRIDGLPEIQETEPNNLPEQAQSVPLNTIVNARANGGADVDVYSVAVTAGQTIVFRTEAATLDSIMQPVLELFDAGGRRVAHSRRKKQQDGSLVYTSDSDQTLLLKIHDTVYAGGNDYVYRLSIDQRPLVDAVLPAVVQAGVPGPTTIWGRHLPDGEATPESLNGSPLKKQQISLNVADQNRTPVGSDANASSIDMAISSDISGNLLPIAVRQTPVHPVFEDENQSPQTITLPADVCGRFQSELDEDTFRFEAVKGQQWQIDVLAHRLGSPADPLLIVEQITKAADGAESAKRLAREDDNRQDPGGAQLPTLTSDPSYTLNVPEDGLYQVRVMDQYAASRGSADLTYVVSIHPPETDFRLVVFDSLPSVDGKAPPDTGAVSLRKGGTYEVPVYAYRNGGHSADIHLNVEGLPAGVTCADSVIRSGQNSGWLVFTAAADAAESVAPVRIQGTAVQGDQQRQHNAQIATLVHGGANGLPRTARVSGALLVCVMKDEEPVTLQSPVTVAELSQDQQLLIPLKVIRRAGFEEKVTVAFAGQPGNVDVPKVELEKGTDTAVARFYFKENAAAGPATLLMYATAQVPYRRNPWQVDRAKQKVDEAVKQLEAANQALTASKTAAEAGAKKVTELAGMLKTYEEQLTAEKTAVTKAQEELKAAVAGRAEAVKKLEALQEVVAKATAAATADGANTDAALKAVQDAAKAVNEASRPITELSARLTQQTQQLTDRQKQVEAKTKQVADAKAAMTAQQQAVEKAKADVTAAEAALKAREAEKKAADDGVKKAEEAAKPQNKNVRALAIPVQITVHPTPGKVTAAVPNNGQLKKSEAFDVKVTVARKNNFAGPVSVQLVLPDGEGRVSSNSAEIPADQTEATLKLTAAADAAAGEIANGVIRATAADFSGRAASFDVPVALKIVE
ncbi:MAG: hypothetical protein R3C49_15350 [Planctomycetaceae bacterium]